VLESIGIGSTAEFSEVLLDEARVALTAGEGFDAPGFVRISYATSLDRLREGTNRILEFVKKRERQGAVAR
jgi:aspartate aminotransferase